MEMRKTYAAVLVLVSCVAAGTVSAQGAEGLGLSPSQTARVVGVMDEGFQSCVTAPVLYQSDCFSQVYRSGSKILGSNAGYWEAEVALTRVSRNTTAFVRANTDKSAGRIRVGAFKVKAIQADALNEAKMSYAQDATRAAKLLTSGSATESKYFKPISDLVMQYNALRP